MTIGETHETLARSDQVIDLDELQARFTGLMFSPVAPSNTLSVSYDDEPAQQPSAAVIKKLAREKVNGKIEHFERWRDGQEPTYHAYFMGSDSCHARMLNAFLYSIEIEEAKDVAKNLDQAGDQSFLVNDSHALTMEVQRYEDGTPYAHRFTGVIRPFVVTD
jgi:hypothetical protein